MQKVFECGDVEFILHYVAGKFGRGVSDCTEQLSKICPRICTGKI